MIQNWEKILLDIPNYDSIATSGDCVFDETAANDSIEFFHRFLTFTQGEHARKPFILQPWQKSVVANIFGWKRPDGTRRYREVLVYVPRKNGKSEFAAGVVSKFLVNEDEPGAQLYSAAAARNQTKYVFDPVKRMIRQNPHMSKRCEVFRHNITCNGRYYTTIASEALTNHGGSTHLGIVDELHAQPNRELVDTLQTSMGARRQPLMMYLTTADWDREGSICNTKHSYAKNVQDGVFEDNTFLPVIFEATKEDDWTDPEVWREANPNLGVSFTEEFLADQCRKAQNDPQFENTFKRLHLNLRTEQAFRWMPLDKWDACDEAFDPAMLDGRQCFAALDLASVNDMASLVLAFPIDDDIFILPFFWCPQDTAEERERRDRQPYVTWSNDGLLTLTPGNTIDYRFIRSRINELGKRYQIREIAFDPWNASTLSQQLANEDGFTLIQFRQGAISMNEPMKRLMAMVLSKKLRHGGNPVLRWNASNIAARLDPSENIRPDKAKSFEKIDGMVALIMAIGRMMANEGVRSTSVYEDQELLVL